MAWTRGRVARAALTRLAPRACFRGILQAAGGGEARLSVTFDCDLDEDYRDLPVLLDGLARRGLRTDFACIGRRMEAMPGIHRRMLDEGHEILNHTHTHPWAHETGAEAFRAELSAAHEACVAATGRPPVGFRMPHFGNLDVYAVVERGGVYRDLEALGYRISSTTMAGRCRDGGRPYRVGRVWELPLSPCPLHPFGILDSYHSVQAPDARHRGEGEFEGLLAELLEEGLLRGAYLNLYLDPSDVASREGFWRFLDRARASLEILPYSALLERLS